MTEQLASSVIAALLAAESQRPGTVEGVVASAVQVQSVHDAYEAFERDLADVKISLTVSGQGYWRSLVFHRDTGVYLCEGCDRTHWRSAPEAVLAKHLPLLDEMRQKAGLATKRAGAALLQRIAEANVERAANTPKEVPEELAAETPPEASVSVPEGEGDEEDAAPAWTLPERNFLPGV